MQSRMDNMGKNGPAKKRLGQNFLINPGVASKMIEQSGIDNSFGVIEIGPGHGALTKLLADTAKKVVAIELDGDLIPELNMSFSKYSNFTLIHADVLKLDLHKMIEEEFSDMPVAVIGNLPYYITTPIIMKLLESRISVDRIVVMVQKEAAERLTAEEGSRQTGAITLAVRYFSSPTIMFTVSPGSFRPIPKVLSAVIRLDIRKKPKVSPVDEGHMFRVIKAAFAQRRKTAVNAIATGLSIQKEKVASAFFECGISPVLRAERLMLDDYAAISDSLLAAY